MTIKVYDNGSSVCFKTNTNGEESTRLYEAMQRIKPFLDDEYPLTMVTKYLQSILPDDQVILT